MPRLTRREAFTAAAALPLTAALPQVAAARAEFQGAGQGLFHRFQLGGYEITTLQAGTAVNSDPKGTFGLNVSEEEFAEVSAAAFLPDDHAVNFFTPVLVNTGAELVLFDTGLSAEAILAALSQAGVPPQAVDVVVLTHMHGDHIGGLTTADGATPVFPKARYVTGRAEYDYWASAGNEGFDKKVRPLSSLMTFVEPGESPLAGITAVEAFGHTPGHMAYLIESADEKLMLTADTANHYLWSLEHPDWEVRFDLDKPKAAETRKRLFTRIAEERLPFIGYHMPSPGLGFVEKKGEGFRFIPHSYQLAVLPK